MHLSLWRDSKDLMAGGAGPSSSPRPVRRSARASRPTSALLQHWAGAFACWGLENREAALRMVTGSTGSSSWAANMEVKCFDLLANPYLVLAGLLATGAAGIAESATLPDPVDVDPAALSREVLEDRGIARLPTTLREGVDLFSADEVLRTAFGQALVDAIVAVRESELELFADATDDKVAAATRWLH